MFDSPDRPDDAGRLRSPRLCSRRKARKQVARLHERLETLEAKGAVAAGAAAPQSQQAPPSAPAAGPEPAHRDAPADGQRHRSTEPQPASPPPPLPPADAGFEERIGTRWVVWVGGLDAGARRLLHGALFDRGGAARTRRAHPARRRCLRWRCLPPANGRGARKAFPTIDALPIANIPAILTAAGTAVAFATVYAAYALYGFLAPATAFILLGMVALGTLAAALLHGPALAGLGVAAAFVTPMLVSSAKAGLLGALRLSRHRHRRGIWRWRASGCGAGSRSRPSCSRCSGPSPACDAARSMVAPHAFHVIVGFVLAALLVVCGFVFGPDDEPDQVEPISSGSLAAYLFGAMLIVLMSGHADGAMIAFAMLVAGTMFVAWWAPAAIGALAAAAAFIFIVFAEWAVRGNPDMLVLPGGALPGIGPSATDGSVSLHMTTAAIFALGFGVAGFLAQGRFGAPASPWSGRPRPCSCRWRC